MKRIFYIILVPSLILAGTYDYLKIPVSSQEGALLNLHGLFGNSPSALFINPASIFENKKVVEAGYGNYILDIQQGYMAYSFLKGENSFMGIGVHFFHLGEFIKTDTFGWEIGKYTAQNIALDLYFPILKKYKVAGSFELYYNVLDEYNSFACAFSFGWNFFEKMNALKDGIWRNSLILKHLGLEIKSFDKEKAGLPLTITYISGLKFRTFETGFSLFYRINDGFDAQISYLYHWGKYLSVSFGYTTAYRDVSIEEDIRNLLTGLVGGIGIDVKKISVFYSYTPFGVFGDVHRVDISYAF